MKLSVIVPVYNCKDFLPDLAATSARLQGDDWELILVDDGSTDGSGKICDILAADHKSVRVVHKKNGGVSSARNMGLDIATGEYIGFLDADDSVKPYMYQRLIESAQTHGSDMVMGGYEKVDADHRTQVCIPFSEKLNSKKEIQNVAWSMAFWNAWINGKYLPAVYGSVWPNLYRRDILQDYQIRFPEDIAIGEDLLFNLEYLYHVRTLSVVNEPLYEYNVANTSATRKCNKSLWHRYRLLLQREEELLIRIYGESEALKYNLHRQRVNYAINVGEEQLCVFLESAEAKQALKALCSDPDLQKSAGYIMTHGKNIKERLQAALIRGKFAGLIRLWLK